MKINFYEIYVNLLLQNKNYAKKLENLPVNEIENIIIYSNTAIGDTLFNTPVLKSLKNKYPEKKIIIILNPTNYTLFKNNPYIDEFILYDGKWKNFFSTLKKLKTYKIDLSLLLHSNEPQATPLAVLSNSKYIIKIPNNKSKYNKFHNNNNISTYGDRHGIFDRLRVLEFLDIKDKNPRMELFLENKNKKEINLYFNRVNINKDKDILIGLQVGASTISRMWFEDKWIDLGKKLLESNANIKIILTGSPSERNLTSKVCTGINSTRVFDCAGQFNLKSASALIGKLDLFITPDTGPLHIAAALGVPTIALFAVAQWYGSNPCFDQNIHLYIQKNKTCIPCIGKSCKYQECMLQISVSEVMLKVDILLKAE